MSRRSKEVTLPLYFTPVTPHLEYCDHMLSSYINIQSFFRVLILHNNNKKNKTTRINKQTKNLIDIFFNCFFYFASRRNIIISYLWRYYNFKHFTKNKLGFRKQKIYEVYLPINTKQQKKSFIFHVAVIFATVSAGIFFQVIQRFTKKLPRFHGNLLAFYLNFILWDKYVIYFHSWVIIKKKYCIWIQVYLLKITIYCIGSAFAFVIVVVPDVSNLNTPLSVTGIFSYCRQFVLRFCWQSCCELCFIFPFRPNNNKI